MNVEEILERLWQRLEELEKNPTTQAEYIEAQKHYRDWKSALNTAFRKGERHGETKGRKLEKAIEIANNAILEGFNNQVIQKLTGLSIAEIEELRKKQESQLKSIPMTRIQLSDFGNSPFERLIGHNPAILNKWNELENAIFQATSLSSDLLEQVRRTLAFGNECEYCMVKGGKPELDKDNKRYQLATAFAEMFALDHKSISDKHFDILREVFDEKEISELCSFISFITACQKLGRIYNLTEDFQENKVTTVEELKNAN